MTDNGRYLIGPGLRDKIRDVITRVDAMPDGGPGDAGEAIHQGIPYRATFFKTGRATGAWAKNATKTVTFRDASSLPTSVTATNLFANLTSTATYNVAVAREGTAWYLISAEC